MTAATPTTTRSSAYLPSHLEGAEFSRSPSSPYVSVSPRHTKPAPRPFHPSVYQPAGTRKTRRVQKPGFPGSTRGNTIREWIPGISTPEGVVVSTAALLTMSPDSADMIIRVAQNVATGVVATVTIGFPSIAVWLSQGIR